MMDRITELNGLYVFETSHRVYYNTAKPVPIKDVIIALEGLQGVLKPLPKLVSSLVGAQVGHTEYLIRRLESGSLVEDVVVRFFFGSKEELDEFLDKMRKKVGMKGIATLAIALLLGAGLYWAATANKAPAPNITFTNNTIIATGAVDLGMTEDGLRAAVSSAIGSGKKQAAEGALKFVAPARTDPNSSVSIEGTEQQGHNVGFSFPPAAIAETPLKVETDTHEMRQQFHSVPLHIRATDLDSKKTGWAGRLDNYEDRLPIELDPGVAESEIFGKATVIVDAALIYREKGKSRELKPARIYVQKVIQ